MLKILVRKQFKELVSPFVHKKNGERRSKAGNALFLLLLLILLVSFASLFWLIAMTIYEPFAAIGMDWLVFSLMGLMAVGVGTLVTVLGTYSGLYLAKDNELLMSLPIKGGTILLSRILVLYVMDAIFVMDAMIPAVIAGQVYGHFDLSAIFCGLLLSVLLSFASLGIACFLGWIVAMAASRIRNKSFAAVAISLVFMALYIYLNTNMGTLVEKLATQGVALGGALSGSRNPAYWIGLAGTGDWMALLPVALICGFLFLIAYRLLAINFLKLATMKVGAKKKLYTGGGIRKSSMEKALLKKEMKHLLNSPAYLINCSLGTILLLVLAVMTLVRRDIILSALSSFPGDIARMRIIPAAAAICLGAGSNDLTAAAVSLEGKTLWILRAHPIPTRKILLSKLKLHLIMTEPPALIAAAAVSLVFELSSVEMLLVILAGLLMTLLLAEFGLAGNLIFPNLTWTNETVAVKQSISTMIGLFGGWIIVALIFGPFFLLKGTVDGTLYVLVANVLTLLLAAALWLWLRGAGARRFEELCA